MFKIILDIVIGVLIIVIASFIPGPAPIGLFWTALLVAIPSLVIGRYAKVGFRWFSLGVVFGGVIVVLVNFSQWGELGPMLAVLQIIPVFASIVSFLFGWVLFAPTRARNKRATG